MKRLSSLAAASILVLLSFGAVGSAPPPLSATGVCSAGLVLTLHPGLPASMQHLPPGIARDIPRAPVSVSVPLYPGARSLAQFVASAIPEYPPDPYLQTGVAEYQTAGSVDIVQAWYRKAFVACGWRPDGSMTTNASALTSGITFASIDTPNLTMEMTFGDTPSGGAYIAYGAEEITYPARPASSYLHGPFSTVRIALSRTVMQHGQPVSHIVRNTVIGRPLITQFVQSINSITGYYTVSGNCRGGRSLVGPVWLSFVRPDGSVAHAYESQGCGEGLSVNGVGWLMDDGRVWNLIGRVVKQQEAKPLPLPFLHSWHGPGLSPWFRLGQGAYDFSARYRPLGCATDLALVGTNGYHVADTTNLVAHLPHFKGGARWAGWTLHLVSGIYRVDGRKVSGNCNWSVRLERTAR